jgi:biotin-(acetyl-CoA carboxylase) ligase
MTFREPTFPPLLTGKPVTAPQRPLERAMTDALKGKAGAGDTYWLKSTRVVDVAIVLEPEVPLAQALQMTYVGQVAFLDAFGVLSPPEIALQFHWPGAIMVNAAVAGAYYCAVPDGAGLNDVPDWLIVDLFVHYATNEDDTDPGLNPDRTSLIEEGCAEFTVPDLIESYSRHFTTWVDDWEADGFRRVHDAWIGRAWGQDEPAGFTEDGSEFEAKPVGLDENGNLMVKPDKGAVKTLDFLPHVMRGRK